MGHMSKWGGRFRWVTMSYPTAMPPALSHPILYHVAPFYFIALFNAPPLQPRINFTAGRPAVATPKLII